MNNPLSRRNKPDDPRTIHKQTMKEEAKREQKEKERLRKLEKEVKNYMKKNKVLLMNNHNNNGSSGSNSIHTDSESDNESDIAYEVIVVPQKPRSALEIYFMDQKAKGSTLSQFHMKLQWRQLSVDEKVMYENLALEDRLRCQHEKKMYKQGKMEGEDVDSPRMGMRNKLSRKKK